MTNGAFVRDVNQLFDELERELKDKAPKIVSEMLEDIVLIAQRIVPKLTRTMHDSIRVMPVGDTQHLIADATVRDSLRALQQKFGERRGKKILNNIRAKYGIIPYDESYANVLQVDNIPFMERAVQLWKATTKEYHAKLGDLGLLDIGRVHVANLILEGFEKEQAKETVKDFRRLRRTGVGTRIADVGGYKRTAPKYGGTQGRPSYTTGENRPSGTRGVRGPYRRRT
jgi:hypothetical protein